MKKYAKSMPCRECIYRKKSMADELLGSFQVDDGRYYFVVYGIQFYCHLECTEKYMNNKVNAKSKMQ